MPLARYLAILGAALLAGGLTVLALSLLEPRILVVIAPALVIATLLTRRRR